MIYRGLNYVGKITEKNDVVTNNMSAYNMYRKNKYFYFT